MKASNETTSMGNPLHYVIYDFWDDYGDPEATGYFWLGKPWLTLSVTAIYLYIVLKVGPDFMRNRKPYDLKWPIRFYNLLLVVINMYLFVDNLINFNFGRDFWGCGEALSERKRGFVLHNGHLFFWTRYLEFFDTFFFILRKKTSQITFLHVFHHGIVPPLMYIGLKFYPVPSNYLLPTTNMIVHVIMYGYYGLATLGPGIQKYLWWKKYLTRLQISQFALLIIHSTQPILFFNNSECNFPRGLIMINYFIGFTFLSLFLAFYKRTYLSNRMEKRSVYQPLKDNCKGSSSDEVRANGKIYESSVNFKSTNLTKVNNNLSGYNKTKVNEL